MECSGTGKYLLYRKWMGQYLLDTYGYDSLFYFAQEHSQKEDGGFQDWFLSIRPCSGKNAECIMFCCDFEDCKGERMYGNN